MFKAKSDNGMLIWADDADKGKKYTCPVCGGEVILRAGDINVPHFAHRGFECLDTWTYDMSEWHRRMQSNFPLECREVVLSKDGEIHRADILQDGVVVEFQHSPLSDSEFQDRNAFYRSFGYRVVWIIDVEDLFESEQLSFTDDNFTIMCWKYAYKYLQSVVPQQDYPNISIWLYLSSDDEDEDSCENIQRVKWAIDQDGYADYSHIVVDSDNLMNLDGDAHASMFSETAYERWSKYLSQHKRGYSLKYQGIRGKPKACYTCPKTNGWAKLWNQCCYCKHNGGFWSMRGRDHSKAMVACLYPHEDPNDEFTKRFNG